VCERKRKKKKRNIKERYLWKLSKKTVIVRETEEIDNARE